MEGPGGADRPVGVGSQGWVHLHRYETIYTVRDVVDGPEDVQSVDYVAHSQRPVALLYRTTLVGKVGQLPVVHVGPCHRLLEDGRVGGDSSHPAVYPFTQLPRGDPTPSKVVQPGTLARLVVEGVESVHASGLLVLLLVPVVMAIAGPRRPRPPLRG